MFFQIYQSIFHIELVTIEHQRSLGVPLVFIYLLYQSSNLFVLFIVKYGSYYLNEDQDCRQYPCFP